MLFEDDYTYITRCIRETYGFIWVDRDITLNNPISIHRDNLIIDGRGHTIDAQGKTRIFNVTGHNVVLKNFIFKNGDGSRDFDFMGGYGGAILNDGWLILEDCFFLNNVAEEDGNDIVNEGHLEITNCIFPINDSNSSIFNLGSIKIHENQFESLKPVIKNSGSGVISKIGDVRHRGVERGLGDNLKYNFGYLDYLIHSGEDTVSLESDISLDSNEFFDYIYGIKIDVDDITIEGNGHTIDANLLTRIFSISGKNIVIKDVTFANGFSSSRSKEDIAAEGRRFMNKGYGGAIYNKGELELINCSFLRNNSSSYGGAVVNITGSCLKIKDCSFTNNGAYNGGAIFNKSKLEIENTSFHYNGGSVYTRPSFRRPGLAGPYVTSHGGAILNENQLEMHNCNFEHNYARWGGAINNCFSRADLKVSKCTFSSNASRFVGAINNYKADIEVIDSKFLDNVSNMRWHGDFGGQFKDNLSSVHKNPLISCGAIRNQGISNIINCKFTSNHLAIRNNGRCDIDNCRFISNKGIPKSIENKKKSPLSVNGSSFSDTQQNEIGGKGHYYCNDCEFECGVDEMDESDEQKMWGIIDRRIRRG